MRRCLTLFLLLLPCLAHAWNAAGHRLVAGIAWQQLSPSVQALIANTLRQHPDHERWQARAKSAAPAAISPKPPSGLTKSGTTRASMTRRGKLQRPPFRACPTMRGT